MAYADLERKKEYHREYMRGWRKENKLHISAYRKKWRKENKERVDGYSADWRERNSLYYWAHGVWRNHVNHGYEMRLTKADLVEMGEGNTRCKYCGVELDYSYKRGRGSQANSPSIDRIDNGQVVSKENIQIICRKCNASKQNRTHGEFIQYCKNVAIRFASIILVFFLLFSSCVKYDPHLYPSLDVLRPGPEVQIVGFTEDGNIIVNESFLIWIYELKEEIKRLRKLVK